MTDKIKGYRELSTLDVGVINQLKSKGKELLDLYNLMAGAQDNAYDQRWVAIAKTDLQTSVMAAVRAVAQPEGI